MKTELATLEVKYIANELKQLIDARVQNIYQPDGLYIQLHKAGQGKYLLRIEKNLIWLTETKPEMPEKVSGFCAYLRKFLKGKKITELEQVNGERILKIIFEAQEEKINLYIELFANGNVVATDENNVIKKATEEREWKDRTIKKGETYKLPPGKKSIFELKEQDFAELSKPETEIAKMGFGMFYAKEIITRAGINPKTKPTEKETKALYKAYKSILDDKTGARLYDDGLFTPFNLKSLSNGKTIETFSKAIDTVNKAEPIKKDKAAKAFEKEKNRIQNLIKKQEHSANKQETEAALLQQKGEKIYENYQELKNILEELDKATKKYSLQEIKKKIKGHKLIKDINEKNKEVTIEI